MKTKQEQPEFTSYIVVDGNKLRPKTDISDNWSAFAAFASQHEFPIGNPEAVNGRTEIPKEEVVLGVMPVYNNTVISNKKAYLIKGQGEPKEGSSNSQEKIGSSSSTANTNNIDISCAYTPTAFTIRDVGKPIFEFTTMDKLQSDYQALQERYDLLEKVFDDLLKLHCDLRQRDNEKGAKAVNEHWRKRAGIIK